MDRYKKDTERKYGISAIRCTLVAKHLIENNRVAPVTLGKYEEDRPVIGKCWVADSKVQSLGI